jgi:hypothetical protein
MPKKNWRPFEEAREFARGLGLKNAKEWRAYCKSGSKPDDIPNAPEQAYRGQWKGVGDWLGTGTVQTQLRVFLSYKEARKFVHQLHLKSFTEWRAYTVSGRKPKNIPSAPIQVYKDEWISFGDWLGTGRVHSRTWLPFEEAREFVRGLGLKSHREWSEYRISGAKPDDIPSTPEGVYKDQWVSFSDWLGNGKSARGEWRPFEEARAFVRSLGLRSEREWRAYCKSGTKPDDIPSNPNAVYEGEWLGLGDWLGTGTIASQNKVWRPFEDARRVARSLGFVSQPEWNEYSRSGSRPDDIPSSPDMVYRDEWRGFPDWLGYTPRLWYRTTLLAILEDLKPILLSHTEHEIYLILSENGMLNACRSALGKVSTGKAIHALKSNPDAAFKAIEAMTDEELEAAQEEKSSAALEKTSTEQAARESSGGAGGYRSAVERDHKLPEGLSEDTIAYIVGTRVAELWDLAFTTSLDHVIEEIS